MFLGHEFMVRLQSMAFAGQVRGDKMLLFSVKTSREDEDGINAKQCKDGARNRTTSARSHL
jgi:hypothetical protein